MNTTRKISHATIMAVVFGCMLAVACLALLAANPDNALARNFDVKDYKGTQHLTYLKSDNEQYIWGFDGEKITKAKSSNKKVATVKVGKTDGQYFLTVKEKKPGTTKITFKVDGKKRTVKLVLTKYENPVKSLKIGSKQMAKKYNSYRYRADGDTSYSIAGKKIAVKAAPGWKLKAIYVGNWETDKVKKVKSGYKFKQDEYPGDIEFKNTKTKAIERIQYVLM